MRKTICSIHTLFFWLVFSLIFCFFSSAVSAADLTLAWDSNSEQDLAGYKIYYKTGSSGAPYDGNDADQGGSGIIVSLEDLSDPENPGFTLSGLSENTVYYLAVTAYNEQGSESGYSNEVNQLLEPAINMYTISS
ncbi:MAG: fibronectin type III domain-containing protein, partial [Deltaproteobacteria bacterium]|nr:fibronectin type III domain-containing protein [Deltaproteobacteria bacterium]